jgi:hypothetical protein
MTLPLQYHNRYVAVKYFLNSYRALSDGRTGIGLLEERLGTNSFLFSDWKILWLGTCAILRTSIDLFKVDIKSCINAEIRNSLKTKWAPIGNEKNIHPIFWKFLRKERDQIIHEYSWAAYEIWLHDDGTLQEPPFSLLAVKPDKATSVLLMRHGHFKGRNSLELLRESADWVELQIFDAIREAGFDPEEQRRLGDFQNRIPL